VLEYNNNPSNKKIAYVGKGILFDTGGVSLKTPPAKMQRMHSDMTGSAVVLGTILALAKIKAKVNVVGVLAIARNDIGSEAYVVQDILKSYEGTTVEIVNTDSEGRLVLADGIAYA
jgi:leucyl aminopeptidase